MDNLVRAFPYPVLSEGNLSFPEGQYLPEIEMGADGFSATIRHELQGAPLISRFLKEGVAEYACSVSIPKTIYKHLHRTSNSIQNIQWDPDSIGEPAILRPMIVCNQKMQCKFSTDDGISDSWIGKHGIFEPGSKIALGPFFRTASSLQSLLAFITDPSLESGQFAVTTCDDDGFYFNVKVSPDLFGFLQHPNNENHLLHRNSIMTHIVSRCFELLAREYGPDAEENGWRSYRNLIALEADMESRGLPIWDSEDFTPEKAATVLHPHQIPRREADEP